LVGNKEFDHELGDEIGSKNFFDDDHFCNLKNNLLCNGPL
jgi:hypothetical protein